jgi:phage recombination protein Bet
MAKVAAVPAKNDPGMVVYAARGGEQVQLSLETVKNFLVTGNKDLVTVQEMVYFIGICKARGMNPFAKDCFLVKYSSSDPAAIITGIDFYRSRAKAQTDCVGWERGVIVQNTGTKEIRYSKGLVLDDEKVVGGWFKAQPVGWTLPFEIEVNLSEYIKTTKEGAVTAFWKKAAMMISKVAESQGLRILWPDEFRGTISAEEAGFQSEQFATMEDLPTGTGQSPEAHPPEVDLGQYNALVAAKKLSKERLEHMEEFFKQTALSQKKSKVTVAQLKEKAATNFAGFYGAFEKWEAVTYPAGTPEEKEKDAGPTPEELAAAEAAGATTAPPISEAAPAAKAEEGAGPGQDDGDGGEGWPDAAQEGVVVPFAERVQKLWHEVIGKGIPLSALKLADGTIVQRMNDFTPENIDEIQKIMKEYKAPRGTK